jgi:hypothetical protein
MSEIKQLILNKIGEYNISITNKSIRYCS